MALDLAASGNPGNDTMPPLPVVFGMVITVSTGGAGERERAGRAARFGDGMGISRWRLMTQRSSPAGPAAGTAVPGLPLIRPARAGMQAGFLAEPERRWLHRGPGLFSWPG